MIRVRFGRVDEQGVSGYQIVRAEGRLPTAGDPVIAYVEQPSSARWLRIEGEVLKALSATTFQTSLFPIRNLRLYKNQEALGPLYAVVVDEQTGRIHITPPVDGEVRADYEADALEFYDALDAAQPPGVRYEGPAPAIDAPAPAPVVQVRAGVDPVLRDLWLSWLPGSRPPRWYAYAVVAVDEQGQPMGSSPSTVYAVVPPDVVPSYVVEEEGPDGSWRVVATTDRNYVAIKSADQVAPAPPVWAQASVLGAVEEPSKARVLISFGPSPGDREGLSPRYRVYEVIGGQASSPTLLAEPVRFTGRLAGYRVRRKVFDGIPPTPDGPDAVTVAELAEDVWSCEDVAPDRTLWQYAVFAIDRAGNASFPALALVEVGDFTPPPAVAIRQVDFVSLMVG